MYEISYGNKYEATKSLSKTDIAKCIRADIREAIRDEKLPEGMKVSVRTKFFSGGSSIDIRVTALPADFPLVEADDRDGSKYGAWKHSYRYTDVAQSLKKALKAISDAYNYDGSEIMVDYFHVRFYSDVDISHDLWEAACLKLEAAESAVAA